jgi:hypothetical protein
MAYYAVTASTNNPDSTFIINGLEYPKGLYIIEYGSYEDNSGTPVNVEVGVANKYTGEVIIPASPYNQYTNGTSVFNSLDSLISHLATNLNP